RRRAKQLEFNAKHGIVPRSIVKGVQDIMEGARAVPRQRTRRGRRDDKAYAKLTPTEVAARIAELERRMYQHARELEFEEAARLRDEINELKQRGFELPQRAAS